MRLGEHDDSCCNHCCNSLPVAGRELPLPRNRPQSVCQSEPLESADGQQPITDRGRTEPPNSVVL